MDLFARAVNWTMRSADHATTVATLATLFGGALAFWIESIRNRKQRNQDLRWRQAEAGKALNDEMQNDELAWNAMKMLDSHGQSFEDLDGNEHTVTQADIDGALTADDAHLTKQEKYIRDAFDNFFYYMAMFDHYIANKLVIAQDIVYPMEYYVNLLQPHRASVMAYLNKWSLTRTIKFLDGPHGWNASRS